MVFKTCEEKVLAELADAENAIEEYKEAIDFRNTTISIMQQFLTIEPADDGSGAYVMKCGLGELFRFNPASSENDANLYKYLAPAFYKDQNKERTNRAA